MPVRDNGKPRGYQWTRLTPIERFWIQVKKTPSCWLWTGVPDGSPPYYGRIFVNGKLLNAHRFSWEIHYGEVPRGLNVLHNCPGGDNSMCVNPDHLWLGTQNDNVQDCLNKGRARGGSRPGEKHHNCRLTLEQVLEIKARYIKHSRGSNSIKALAIEFGISASHVGAILGGYRWKILNAND